MPNRNNKNLVKPLLQAANDEGTAFVPAKWAKEHGISDTEVSDLLEYAFREGFINGEPKKAWQHGTIVRVIDLTVTDRGQMLASS